MANEQRGEKKRQEMIESFIIGAVALIVEAELGVVIAAVDGAGSSVPDTGGVHDGVSDVVLLENAGKQMGKRTWPEMVGMVTVDHFKRGWIF